jgi:preprotein translocase subunit SecD
MRYLRPKRAGLFRLLLWLGLVVASLQPASAAPLVLVLEVAGAAPGFDQRTGEPIVTVTLTIASLLDFAKFTAANVGAKTQLRVDGEVVTTIVIKEAIRGTLSNPSFQISGNFTVQDVVDLAKRLSSANATIEVEIVPS